MKKARSKTISNYFFPFIFWFYFNTPCDWLKILTISRLMSKPGTDKHSYEFLVKLTLNLPAPIFPRSALVTCIFLEF